MNILWQMDPLGNRAEMPWIPVPPKLADKPTLAYGPPSESRIDALHTATSNLADEPTLANGPPSESRIDALITTTPNLADEPTLANGPYICCQIYPPNAS